MKPKAPPWWQNFQLLAWIAGGIAAAGTLIVGAATYINLPKTVEAVQQKNTLQDEAILELKKSNEIWQNIYQQQQQTPKRSQRQEWQDDRGRWWCCDQDCHDNEQWYRCDG